MQVISYSDVQKLGLTLDQVISALEDAFRESAAGDIVWKPKATIGQPDGAFFIGSLGCWKRKNVGIFHNIMGVPAANVPPGTPHYTSVQILSDYSTGMPLACIDGTFTSTMLPVGVTALAAKRFANPQSKTITFIGAGAQSKANLVALKELFPLRDVRILTRTERSAKTFAEQIKSIGLAPQITSDPKAALSGADMIVSTVPSGPGLKPFLDPQFVSKGAFVSAVDLGRSWTEGFASFDRLMTDDRAQAQVQHAEGRMPLKLSYDTELAELVSDKRPGRQGPEERIAFIHPGNLVGVLGITALIYDAMKQKGRPT